MAESSTTHTESARDPHWLDDAISILTTRAHAERYHEVRLADQLDTAAGFLTHIRDSGMEHAVTPLLQHIAQTGLTHDEVIARLGVASDQSLTTEESSS